MKKIDGITLKGRWNEIKVNKQNKTKLLKGKLFLIPKSLLSVIVDIEHLFYSPRILTHAIVGKSCFGDRRIWVIKFGTLLEQHKIKKKEIVKSELGVN